MNKKNKNQVTEENEIIEDNDNIYEEENLEPDLFKWVDEYNFINIEDIRQAKISHSGDGNFVVLFFSKTSSEPIEVQNKHFNTKENVVEFIYFILQTPNANVFDFNYIMEHPEEFE